jgi:hypothetical protein
MRMYIPAFWCGVIAVLGIEFLLFLAIIVYVAVKGMKK